MAHARGRASRCVCLRMGQFPLLVAPGGTAKRHTGARGPPLCPVMAKARSAQWGEPLSFFNPAEKSFCSISSVFFSLQTQPRPGFFGMAWLQPRGEGGLQRHTRCSPPPGVRSVCTRPVPQAGCALVAHFGVSCIPCQLLLEERRVLASSCRKLQPGG